MARKKKTDEISTATEEIETVPVEAQPLPDSLGLTHTSSPVDLPEPAVPLPHDGLRWTTTVMAVAALFLFVFNAHSLRGWAYELTPNDTNAKVVAASETWYSFTASIGVTSIAVPPAVNMPVMKAIALSKLCARKKIQPRRTMWNVMRIPRRFGIGFQFLGRNSRQRRSMASTEPCNAPQMTKFQLAPCQRPPSSIVVISATQSRASPWREPPSET